MAGSQYPMVAVFRESTIVRSVRISLARHERFGELRWSGLLPIEASNEQIQKRLKFVQSEGNARVLTDRITRHPELLEAISAIPGLDRPTTDFLASVLLGHYYAYSEGAVLSQPGANRMAANELFVRIRGKEHGPFDSDKLKRLAVAGKITRDDEVSRDRVKWIPAGNVKGLFPDGELMPAPPPPPRTQAVARTTPPPAPIPVHAPPARQPSRELVKPSEAPQTALLTATFVSASPMAPPALAPSSVQTIPCPFCAEAILPAAKKCKHCGEIVDVAMRAATAHAPQVIHAAPQPTVHITNTINNVVAGGVKRWSPIVAFFLSLLIPGLGQLNKGQLINGFVWFVVVAIGYVALIVPGLILHICCAIGAAMGDPYR